MRTCIGCREKGEPAAFFRMVAGPGGEVVAELGNRLPGRGAHCCFRLACAREAVKPKNLARALRAEVRAPAADEIAARVRALLRRRMEGLLAAAWRKEALVPGRDAALRELAGGGRLLLAEDLAAGSRRELPAGADPLELPLGMEEIGRLLGRAPVGILCIRDDSLAAALEQQARHHLGLGAG
ncbi:MAG: DUF448 domain-containing protein [Nitrospinota bacterium]